MIFGEGGETMERTERHTFTLMELLLILSAALLLAAVMIPAAGRAMSRGEEVSCTDNMKRCVAAALGYASENDGKMNLKTHDFPFRTLLWSMVRGVMPDNHLRTAKVRLNSFDEATCPDLEIEIPEPGSAAAGKFTAFYAVPYTSMGGTAADTAANNSRFYDLVNREAYYNPTGKHTVGAIGLDTGKVKDAAAAAVFAEAVSFKTGKPHYYYGLTGDNMLTLRHAGRTNMAFADGHVSPLDKEHFAELRKEKRILLGGAKGSLYDEAAKAVVNY